MPTTPASSALRTRRVRTFCLIVAVASCVLIAVSSKRACRAMCRTVSGSEYSAVLERGLLVLGRQQPAQSSRAPYATGLRFEADRNWGDDISLAWRPYHISQTVFPFAASHHALALPLWLIALPALVAAAYTQGLVVGTRRADRGRCGKCGYSRAGLAAGAACPECGVA